MDFLNLRSLVFLLSTLGCCLAKEALPPGPVDGVLGKNVTFKTNIKSGDFITISWSFDGGKELVSVITYVPKGITVGPGYTGRASLNITTGELRLGPLTGEDSGDYSVNLITSLGKPNLGETSLRVLEPVSDVTITSNMAAAVEINSTVVLSCAAKGSFLKYGWLNGSAPLVADGKHVTLSADGTKVTVAGVLRNDLAGPVYCTAANDLEKEKSAPFNLTVSYGPENIAMTISPTSKIVRKGSNVTLTCTARSSPDARIQWIHNGVIRKETGSTLALLAVDEKQAGNFTCMASNAKTLRFLSAPPVSFKVVESISGPKITGPTAVLVAGNSTASLGCSATAGVVTARAWTKDGEPLSPSDRVSVSADGVTVTIKPVQKGDSGEYKCTLTNDVSTATTASFSVLVNFGPEAVAVSGEDAVEVRDPVTLTCSSASVPAAGYAWRFNGTLTAVKTAVYAIESAVYKDTGVYTCDATNTITGITSSFTHKLSVKEEGALDEGLSDGAIAGIIIGVLLALAVIIGVVIYMRRKPVESPY